MNTMIGYTPAQETDVSSKVWQSLLLLARNFLSPADTGIQRRHAWDAQELMTNVPPRVWRRHSALLTLLAEQANTCEGDPTQAEISESSADSL
jgi:hypothetical protein